MIEPTKSSDQDRARLYLKGIIQIMRSGESSNKKLSDFRIAANWEVSDPKPSMRNFHLSNENLSGYDLSDANLENADLGKAGLWATNLSGANLRGTDFRGAKFVGTIMKGAVATHAKFSRAVLLV